jgi:urease accessory protein
VTDVLKIEHIIGNEADGALAPALHRLQHAGVIEHLFVPEPDARRRRLRLTTDQGTECGIALARNEILADGAILYLDEGRAIVVRVGEAKSLRLRPKTRLGALHLGWTAGNLHWRVKFENEELVVLLDGARDDYVSRIAELLSAGLVDVTDDLDQ